MGSQCPDTTQIDTLETPAQLNSKSVFVGFILTFMIGDIVGPGNNGGGNDDDKERPRHPLPFSEEEVHFTPDNKCAFNIERCRAQVQRKPQLFLSSDQSEIHWPTVN